MITFNADEVYEMAEQIERNGAAFYRKAAGSSAGKQAGECLSELAAMEDRHERTFAQMRSELAEHEKTDAQFDPDSEGALYLRSMVEGKVFDFDSEPAAALTGSESLGDILRTAIGLEKDSIVFYYTMKKMAIGEEAVGGIDEIIEQEVGHIATLSKQLAALA